MKWPVVSRKRHDQDVRRLQDRLTAQADRHHAAMVETEKHAALLVERMVRVEPRWEHYGQAFAILTCIDAEQFHNLLNGPMSDQFWSYIGKRVSWEVERRLRSMDFATLRLGEQESKT